MKNNKVSYLNLVTAKNVITFTNTAYGQGEQNLHVHDKTIVGLSQRSYEYFAVKFIKQSDYLQQQRKAHNDRVKELQEDYDSKLKEYKKQKKESNDNAVEPTMPTELNNSEKSKYNIDMNEKISNEKNFTRTRYRRLLGGCYNIEQSFVLDNEENFYYSEKVDLDQGYFALRSKGAFLTPNYQNMIVYCDQTGQKVPIYLDDLTSDKGEPILIAEKADNDSIMVDFKAQNDKTSETKVAIFWTEGSGKTSYYIVYTGKTKKMKEPKEIKIPQTSKVCDFKLSLPPSSDVHIAV